MCGRYGLYEDKDDEFFERFKVERGYDFKPNYNAAPGQRLPVIKQEGDERAVEVMKWGLVPFWAKDEKIGYKMINARAETVFEKPSYRNAIKKHRALIPASGFYEWKKIGKEKQPYYIHPKDQSIFAFAGLYETWKPKDGEQLTTFTIITTTPNEEMMEIHDRMPVILHPEFEDMWLDPDNDDTNMLAGLLKPYMNGRLEMHVVSSDVNFVKNNDNYLIKPVQSH